MSNKLPPGEWRNEWPAEWPAGSYISYDELSRMLREEREAVAMSVEELAAYAEGHRRGIEAAIRIVETEPELPITKWYDVIAVVIMWLASIVLPVHVQRSTVRATKLAITKRLRMQLEDRSS